MLNRLKKKQSQKGFTIIEVMIVLAIAALILLIVFLAVPALQRSSRNTQRKSDVSRVGSAAQTVISNNNGSLTALTSANVQAELGTLSYYTNTNVTVTGAASGTVTNGTDVDHVNIYTDATCSTMTGGQGATSTGATSREIAIVYSAESGSGTDKLCITE